MATQRQVTFLISANIDQFRKGLNTAQKRFERFGRTLRRTGRKMSRNITAPLVAAAGASVKMASDFESSMTRIETLVGLGRDQVQGMRRDVLALSGETARAPHELSEALFAVTSAGLRGEEAMQTLEMAAKASAIGLGETRDIARATTGILQSYANTGLTAAEATDTLIGVVREGNLEASELAPVLGRVTGIASQLGISFDQVGASIASFTRLGVSAEEAVTGLRGIMNALLKQTPKASQALSSVGLSFDEVKAAVREDGLAQALVMLMQRFEGNDKALADFAGRVRGLAAILGTAGAQSESYLQIARNIEDSTGNLDKGFQRVSETMQFKFDQALTNLKTSAIELGTILMPMAKNVIDAVSDMAKWFSTLDRTFQATIVTAAAFVAAIGPTVWVAGAISTAIGVLIGALTALMSPVTLVMAGIAGLILIGKNIVDNWDTLAIELENIWDGIKVVAMGLVKAIVNSFGWMFKQIISIMKTMAAAVAPGMAGALAGVDVMIQTTMDSVNESFEGVKEQFQDSKERAEESRKNMVTLGESFQDLAGYVQGAASSVWGYVQSLVAAEQQQRKVQASAPSQKRSPQQQGINMPGEREIQESLRGMKVAGQTIGDLRRKWSKGMDGIRGATVRMGQALQSTATSAITGFAETLGQVFSGDMGAGSFFESILMVVVDFANKFGKLLIGAGLASKAFQDLIVNPVAAIAAGVALVALTTAIKGLLSSGPGGSAQSAQQVNDAMITSRGEVIEFHPDDNILAMKDFGALQQPAATGGQRMFAPINLNIDSYRVSRVLARLEDKRSR